jgi:hypothetical protein
MPRGDGLEEAFLLLPEHLGDAAFGGAQFRIGLAHLRHQRRHQLVEEGRACAQLVAMADGTAGDAAQHIAAAGVAGNHAVADRERAGADVVGNHLERGRSGVTARRAGLIDGLLGGAQQGGEQVDLVVRVHMLQHRGEAFQAHAGVDAGLGQRMHHAVFAAVELHEDVVPDLDVAVAVLLRAARGAAGHVGTVVVEDLRAGAAGAGVAHHPEVVGGVARALVVADAHDALGRQPDHVLPDRVGLVVLGVHGGPELVGRQLEVHGQQFPGVLQCVLLEVIAEAEVAQHLEEGVVARGVADVVQVVVLAAGANAFLARRGTAVGPLVEAQEHILELVHAGVGEQQRRVVAGYHGRTGHHGVALAREVLEEGAADLGGFHAAGRPLTGSDTGEGEGAARVRAEPGETRCPTPRRQP